MGEQAGCFLGCSGTVSPTLVLSLQALLAVKSVPVDEDPETEVPTHPEDGTPQPGNSKVRGRAERGQVQLSGLAGGSGLHPCQMWCPPRPPSSTPLGVGRPPLACSLQRSWGPGEVDGETHPVAGG